MERMCKAPLAREIMVTDNKSLVCPERRQRVLTLSVERDNARERGRR